MGSAVVGEATRREHIRATAPGESRMTILARDGSVVHGRSVVHGVASIVTQTLDIAHALGGVRVPAEGTPGVGPGAVDTIWVSGNFVPVDSGGRALTPEDVAYIGANQPVAAFDYLAIARWAAGEMPLGMPPERWSDWKSSLYTALVDDRLVPEEVDLRIKGSAAEFFSSVKKPMPTFESLAAELQAGVISPQVYETAVRGLTAWLGEPGTRRENQWPTARPFDSMYCIGYHQIGEKAERSDYGLNFSSDQMVLRALSQWDTTRPG